MEGGVFKAIDYLTTPSPPYQRRWGEGDLRLDFTDILVARKSQIKIDKGKSSITVACSGQ